MLFCGAHGFSVAKKIQFVPTELRFNFGPSVTDEHAPESRFVELDRKYCTNYIVQMNKN